MRKKLLTLISLLGVLCFTGCTTSTSITYEVLNENIKVTLKTSQGYKLVNIGSGQFEVQDKSGESILNAIFIDESAYNSCSKSIDGVDIDINGNDCIYYTVDGEAGIENEYLVDISNSDVYLILGSLADSDIVNSVMQSITVEGVK